jgi:hypothetical protein
MRLILAFFVLVSVSTPAVACISALEPSLDWMIKGSTLIVRGQVLREIGTSTENLDRVKQHRSEVLIERVYVGAPPAVIRVNWKEYSLCPRAFLKKDDYALFFLRASGSEFVLVDEEFGKLKVSHWQDASQSPDPFVAIERDLKLAIQNDSGRQRIDDVLLLGSLRRPMDTSDLRALLPSNDEVMESAVHLALLKLHDYTKLEAAGRLVETIPEKNIFMFPKDEAVYLRTHIGTRIGLLISGIQERSQLPVLQRFSLSSNYWLRQRAAYALRHLHDPSNVPYLIKLLDDPWEETRIQGMRGLQELLGFGWVTDPEGVDRWRAWWKAEGKSRYGK